MRDKKGRFIKGHKVLYLHTKESANKVRQTLKGHLTPNNVRRKISAKLKGNKSLLWKGGISPIHEYIRKSLEYRLWREAVLKRDNFTCIWCGSKDNIEVDHIKPFAYYPELRFAIDNGRTLCKTCHSTTDTYSYKCKGLVVD